jgi:hypothetical protein
MSLRKQCNIKYYYVKGLFNYRIIREDKMTDKFRLFAKIPKSEDFGKVLYIIRLLNELNT